MALSLLLLVVAALALAAPDWTDCPTPCHCKWSSGKKTAICREGGFVTLPSTLDSDMQVLDLSGNSIPHLPRDAFKNAGLINLQRIFLRNAHLKRINRDAFRDLIILIEIDLSDNEIAEIEPDTFLGNERLRVIYLNRNPIRELKQAQFPPLPHLRSLEMEECQLEAVHRNAFIYLASLESLNMKSNRLRYLSEAAFLNFAHLKSLELNGNPWSCDCNLRGFRDWFLSSKLHSDPLTCFEPENLSGLQWQSIPSDDFACPPNITLSHYPQVRVEAGGNVTFGCHISGDPEPEVTWLFDGKPATSNSTIVSSEEGILDKWVNISVVNVSDLDAGVYTCLARNSLESISKNVTLVLPEVMTATTVSKSDSGLLMWIIICVSCTFIFSIVCAVIAVACVKVRGRNRRKNLKASVSFNDQEKKLLDVSIATTTDRGTGSCEAISTEMEMSEPPVHITIESEPLPLTVYPPPPEFSTSVLPAGAYGNILISVSVSRDPMIDTSRCPDLLDLPHRASKTAIYPGMATLPRRPRATLQYDNMGPRITAGGSSTLSLPDSAGDVPPPPPPPLQLPQCTPLTSEFVSL
ncbi:peroxidasin-like protein [Agrilus planipennis]|uniref:Peroxidasin-like protein n=1 Tax=Agrilus planipennis TaxID=224129 RepID=A0A1W4XGW3_AGRPL|nr:peroxidasin-like protein [Agrilus planipennis]